mmetsp:Transcript_11814/g.14731  ORF Transcript_11814/g.14731 Transcript_11814/m.14731 type:complete len:301 (+) Transcript_11814:140-1042(+)|eukprot:CAMPEP_0172500286 /NCGR_PEP_ID=MMETSP1066-20121228/136486_1 /TAXON_ID=671091 /ORGANISM="Coscinodiscus wailesii, Strain CCMP2513" /LENGTH=300 /DNA_ID=CAMNT_0013274439 /DNA_START=137 /DNA_END=1039 /DNA_ORIENTATION=+
MPPFGHDSGVYHTSHVSLMPAPSSQDDEDVLLPTFSFGDTFSNAEILSSDSGIAAEQMNDYDAHMDERGVMDNISNQNTFEHMNMLNQSLLSTSTIDTNIFHHIRPAPSQPENHNCSDNNDMEIVMTSEQTIEAEKNMKLASYNNASISMSTSAAATPRSALKTTMYNTAKEAKRNSKSVSFKNVHIREYDIILGDHPCCSCGPALSLGWDHSDTKIVEIGHFERTHSPRRSRRQLKMGSQLREKILFDNDAAGAACRGSSRSMDEYVDIVMDSAIDNGPMGFFFLPREVFKSMAVTVRE